MNKSEIEHEINARVEFKMNELLTGIKNRVTFKYCQAFDMTIESQHVWQSFEEVAEMVKKEIEMATPSDTMYDDKRREKKDIAVNELVEYINNQTRSYSVRLNVNKLVSIIEKAQHF